MISVFKTTAGIFKVGKLQTRSCQMKTKWRSVTAACTAALINLKVMQNQPDL
jgi:hypothetical protein